VVALDRPPQSHRLVLVRCDVTPLATLGDDRIRKRSFEVPGDPTEGSVGLDNRGTERRQVTGVDQLARAHVAESACRPVGVIDEQLSQIGPWTSLAATSTPRNRCKKVVWPSLWVAAYSSSMGRASAAAVIRRKARCLRVC
jgi:hypothetical protein